MRTYNASIKEIFSHLKKRSGNNEKSSVKDLVLSVKLFEGVTGFFTLLIKETIVIIAGHLKK